MKTTKDKLKELKEKIKQNPNTELTEELVQKVNTDLIESVSEELEQPEFHKLTYLQKRFVHFYLICRNASKSAILAGYSKKRSMQTGYDLLKKDLINEYIEYKEAEYEVKIQEAIELNKNSQIVSILNYIDVMKNDENPNHTAILKAFDMINKLLNLYSDINFNQQNIITDKELIIKIVGKSDTLNTNYTEIN